MLQVFAWAIALPLSVALSIYTIEVLAGLKSLRGFEPRALPDRLTVIVPAHNEQAAIGGTIRSIKQSLPQGWRILVVADNCTDATAELARAAGAETTIRSNPEARGKGFALAWARDYLAANPPEVVVVIDADCWIDGPSLRHLGASSYELNSPVQAVNLLAARSEAPPVVQISNFAMVVKNLVRARGLYRMYGTVPLFGTGMAFPWEIFKGCPLAGAETVEDLALSVALAESGVAVHFDEHARVCSPSAAPADMLGQRRRWEHGFLIVAASKALPLVARSLTRLSTKQFGLGLHLCVPPLALLLSLSTTCLALCAALAAITDVKGPAQSLGLALAAAVVVTLAAWLKEGRGTLSLAALARTPKYALSKLPIYMSFFTDRQSDWNRTRRDDEA